MKGSNAVASAPNERNVQVSRNVMDSAKEFDEFELNTIIWTISILFTSKNLESLDSGEKRVFLDISAFKRGNENRKTLVDRLRELRKKEIKYSLSVPGFTCSVFTGLFSSVTDIQGGAVGVTVSNEAVPWLLYVGKGVGFSYVERSLFIELQGVIKKRMYLFLCSKMSKNYASFRISLEDFIDAVGSAPGTKANTILKTLNGLRDALKSKGSRYILSYNSITETKGRGRPRIIGVQIVFKLHPELCIPDAQLEQTVLNQVQNYYSILPQNKRNLDITSLFSEIVERKISEDLYDKLVRLKQIDEPHLKKAYILAKILREDYGIELVTNKTTD